MIFEVEFVETNYETKVSSCDKEGFNENQPNSLIDSNRFEKIIWGFFRSQLLILKQKLVK